MEKYNEYSTKPINPEEKTKTTKTTKIINKQTITPEITPNISYLGKIKTSETDEEYKQALLPEINKAKNFITTELDPAFNNYQKEVNLSKNTKAIDLFNKTYKPLYGDMMDKIKLLFSMDDFSKIIQYRDEIINIRNKIHVVDKEINNLIQSNTINVLSTLMSILHHGLRNKLDLKVDSEFSKLLKDIEIYIDGGIYNKNTFDDIIDRMTKKMSSFPNDQIDIFNKYNEEYFSKMPMS